MEVNARLYRDGLAGITERHPDLNVSVPPDAASYPGLIFSERTGDEVAFSILNDLPPRSVSYITLGPMTTLARLVRLHRDVFNTRIGRVLSMGGALDVPGNTSPVAECRLVFFGCHSDPDHDS